MEHQLRCVDGQHRRRATLARGMQGLASGLARRVNRKLRRRGSLFSDRYHAHALASPTEVRHAIVYVLRNYKKHPVAIPDLGTAPVNGLDPCSSARWFSGWAESTNPPPELPPVAEAHTWLLKVGWMRSQCASCAKLTGAALERDPFVCQKCYRERRAETSVSRRAAVASSIASQRAA
jgi:hypothetical protein